MTLLPIVLTLVLAFKTRNAVFSLAVGCLAGVLLAGYNPASGLAWLVPEALGNRDFIWVMTIEIAIGILVAFYFRAGVIRSFGDWAANRIKSRRGATGFAWMLGLFIFFSDYFSPLFSGPIARPLTDRHKVSREMLAYTLDSGSAPVSTLVPITGWAVYISGLMRGYGPVESVEDGMALFIRAIPFNFYGWLTVILSGLFAFALIPHFGPMKVAERRALVEGKVLRDGAVPLSGEEFEQVTVISGKSNNLIIYLLVPVAIILTVAISTFFILGTAKTLDAFLAAVIYQSIAMALGGYFDSVKDMMDVATKGIKGVLPAIMILALAYCINTISKNLGTDQYIIAQTEAFINPAMLSVVVFITAGTISFFTGTSWGTYAIMFPFVMPVAFNFSGGDINTQVLAAVGAVVGGALFGDHCSPVSDTTCLSSFGAASDHMDHVTTQMPYALTTAAAASVLFLIIGMVW